MNFSKFFKKCCNKKLNENHRPKANKSANVNSKNQM